MQVFLKEELTLADSCCHRGVSEVGEEWKEVWSNRLRKVRGARGQVVGRWEETSVVPHLERGVKWMGDDEVDIGQVVSAGGWGSDERKVSMMLVIKEGREWGLREGRLKEESK